MAEATAARVVVVRPVHPVAGTWSGAEVKAEDRRHEVEAPDGVASPATVPVA
jgi:hypothetical protein